VQTQTSQHQAGLDGFAMPSLGGTPIGRFTNVSAVALNDQATFVFT
jgi:hypothetical protein